MSLVTIRNRIPIVVIFLNLSLIGYLFACQSNPKTAGEQAFLAVYLSLDKDSYYLNEDIIANVELKNIGNNSILVNRRMRVYIPAYIKDIKENDIPEIYFTILTDNGIHGMPPGGALREIMIAKVDPLSPQSFVWLEPGESIQQEVGNLSFIYGLRNYGDYKVNVLYKNQADPGNGKIAWKGEEQSNIVTFRIEP